MSRRFKAERLRATIADMTDSGRIDVGQARRSHTSSKDDFRLLDDQDLSNLRSAIDDAQQRMKALQEETVAAKDRVSELNAEIAREKAIPQLLMRSICSSKSSKTGGSREQPGLKRFENNQELIAPLRNPEKAVCRSCMTSNRAILRKHSSKPRPKPPAPPRPPPAAERPAAPPSKTYQLNLVGDSGKTLTATTSTDPTAF